MNSTERQQKIEALKEQIHALEQEESQNVMQILVDELPKLKVTFDFDPLVYCSTISISGPDVNRVTELLSKATDSGGYYHFRGTLFDDVTLNYDDGSLQIKFPSTKKDPALPKAIAIAKKLGIKLNVQRILNSYSAQALKAQKTVDDILAAMTTMEQEGILDKTNQIERKLFSNQILGVNPEHIP